MTASATPVLSLRSVRRSFGSGRGLAGVDLTVDRGEIYGLLGPNGAGKTSLVRALAGRLRLDEGEIRVAGGAPGDPAVRRSLGLVPQELALYHELSVEDNLVLLGRLAGLARAAAVAAAETALGWIDLVDRRRDVVATLSGGQKRRVNLAAGVLHRPAMLVLDEPTVGVDLPARDRIHRMLRDLRRDGMAILLATHDLDQAREVCDRVGFLVDGRIREEGAVDELVGRHFPDGAAEVTLVLGREPDEPARESLRRSRLISGGDSLVWSGPLVSGVVGIAALARDVEALGLPVRDARVREPGLGAVYLRVTGREFDA